MHGLQQGLPAAWPLQRLAQPRLPSAARCAQGAGQSSARRGFGTPRPPATAPPQPQQEHSGEQAPEQALPAAGSAPQRQQGRRLKLPLDDPMVQWCATLLQKKPGEVKLPPMLYEMAVDSRRQQEAEVLADPLFQARVGTAVALQGMFRNVQARDRRLKILISLVSQVQDEMRRSYEWRQLQATLSAAEAAAPGLTWSSFRAMHAYCLGSIEARRSHVEEVPVLLPHNTQPDFSRAWASSMALWQLAASLLLAGELGGLAAAPCFCDPAFTALDRRLIAALGGALAPAEPLEEGGWLELQEPALVVAWNCPHLLNERLVHSAVLQRALPHLAYIGTSSTYYSQYQAMWRESYPLGSEAGGPEGGEGRAGAGAGAQQQQPSPPAPAACASCSGGAGPEGLTDGDPGRSRLAALAAAGAAVELELPRLGYITTSATRLHVFPADTAEAAYGEGRAAAAQEEGM